MEEEKYIVILAPWEVASELVIKEFSNKEEAVDFLENKTSNILYNKILIKGKEVK